MPTEAAASALRIGGDAPVASRRVLRLAFGTAACLWFSQVVGWPLSFVAPILTLILLALPRPAPGLKAGLAIVILTALAAHGGLVLLPMLLHQRAAGILLLTLALFYSFYVGARGGPAAVGMLMTVGLTLTVAIGSVSVDAVLAVAQSVSFSALVGVAFVWFAFGLLPDVDMPETTKPAADAAPPTAAAARRSAVRSLSIVLPVAILFLYSSASAGLMGVMIKVASMAQQVSAGNTRAAARSLILATLIGGLAAVIAWQWLSVWPSLTLYTLLIALAGLVFGPRIFAGRGLRVGADTWSYAYLTMIVILAPAVLDTPFGSGAGYAFADRLWMFVWATLYGVAAVYVFDAFWPAKDTPAASAD